MRIRSAGVVTAALLAASLAAYAETGQEALTKALDKCARQHSEIRDLTVVQAIVIPSGPDTILAEHIGYEKGDRSRTEMTMLPPPGADADGMAEMMGKIVTISDGKSTWMISPMSGTQEMPGQHDPSSANCWGLKLEGATVTGSEQVDGRDCWVVASSSPKDSVNDRYWLDKSNYDVLRGETSDAEGHTLHWVLSDFRTLTGSFQYPYRMVVFAGDTVVASMQVKSIQVNTGLADTLFDPERVQVNKRELDDILRQLMERQGEDSSLTPDSAAVPQK